MPDRGWGGCRWQAIFVVLYVKGTRQRAVCLKTMLYVKGEGGPGVPGPNVINRAIRPYLAFLKKNLKFSESFLNCVWKGGPYAPYMHSMQ